MNQKLAKKIRKEVNSKIRQDVHDIFKIIGDENIIRRIGYALKIILKYKLGEPLKVKNG